LGHNEDRREGGKEKGREGVAGLNGKIVVRKREREGGREGRRTYLEQLGAALVPTFWA